MHILSRLTILKKDSWVVKSLLEWTPLDIMGSLACSLDEVELHDTDVKLPIFGQSLFDPVAQMDCQAPRKHI